jgi:hypothetical protein
MNGYNDDVPNNEKFVFLTDLKFSLSITYYGLLFSVIDNGVKSILQKIITIIIIIIKIVPRSNNR